jgi:hypothetical protein
MSRINDPVRVVEGYTRDLGIPVNYLSLWKQGDVRIYNAARPFPCHDSWRGEFLRGVFYGMIDSSSEFAEGYIDRANSLDAYQLVWVEREKVETWGRKYCKKYGVEYDDYPYEKIAQSYIRHTDRESL